jgi:hypothetical protein
MSLQFNIPASPYNGIIQRIEQEAYGMDGLGRISGNSQLLGQWTTSVNLAKTDALRLILDSDGKVQFDDSNHTDNPIVYFDIVADQRQYSFTADEQSNLILDIAKVAILKSATDTTYEELKPRDARQDDNSPYVTDDSSVTGVPYDYDRTSSGIKFDPIPDYSATNGLKVYIDRETTFYTTADTTKTTGFDPRIDEYLVVKPMLNYAMTNTLASVPLLRERVALLEKDIKRIYGRKGADERKIITHKKIRFI